MSILVTNRDSFEEMWRGILGHGGAVRCARFVDLQQWLKDEGQRLVVIDAGDSSIMYAGIGSLAGFVKQARILLAGRPFTVEDELSSLAAGVAGCCSPALSTTELATVVEVVQRGGIWVSKDALPYLLSRLQGVAATRGAQSGGHETSPSFEQRWAQLTPREREIASRVARGETNKVIARHLDISDATIKAHLTSVFQKLKVSGRLQLALLLSGKEAPSSAQTS